MLFPYVIEIRLILAKVSVHKLAKYIPNVGPVMSSAAEALGYDIPGYGDAGGSLNYGGDALWLSSVDRNTSHKKLPPLFVFCKFCGSKNWDLLCTPCDSDDEK